MPARPRPVCATSALSLAIALLSQGAAWAQESADTPAPSPSPTAAGEQAPPARTSAPAAERRGAKPAAASERLDRVELQGGPSDTAQRRAATAAKIVIGREELDRFGDSSVADVLKRLPGVTLGGRPGRGGEIRMRGMGGGYTQILVNGERMPPGFQVDQLPPDQIERIEVMRAPTAEFGARAVAGTINIVLREALLKRLNDLRLVLGSERGLLQPQLSWTRNDKLGEQGHAYNLALTASEHRNRDDIDTRIHTRDLRSDAEGLVLRTGEKEEQRRHLNANGRLQLRLDGGAQLNLMPFVVLNRVQSNSQLLQQPAQAYERSQSHSESEFSMLRLGGTYSKRLSEDSRLELRGGLGSARLDSDSLRQEFKAAGGALLPSRTQQDLQHNRDRSLNLNGKFSQQLGQVEGVEHSLVSGLELEHNQRRQQRNSLQDGTPRPELAEFGDDFDASTLRLAAYVQDEWNPSKQWSTYAGLRWEGIRTSSSGSSYAVRNSAQVLTPLLHAVWKPDEKSRDQIRMSLTRSYRSPNTQDLIARPSINNQYPSGSNTANEPDRAGNPNLRPETAIGVDLALERYLSKGGVLSASLFARQISDLMRNVTRLESVSWSSEQRWVSRPQNIGGALTTGIELEAKFRLDELLADALPISLRSNLSLFHSRVDEIPGPNNRLDQQPRYTANFGADYRLRSLPLQLGASLNLTPVNLLQQSLLQQSRSDRKRVFDAFALWNINRDWALRLSASNLAPLDYSNSTIINTVDQLITTDNYGRTFTTWQLRLEVKL